MKLNKATGEIGEKQTLNEVIIRTSRRANKSLRYQLDFSNCPTLTEQHSANVTDLNYLIQKFKPDELQAYINARNTYRQEITGHDFSAEPSNQDARNLAYNLKKAFDALDPDLKVHFKSHVEFLKYIDNPDNQAKLLKLGLITKKEIAANTTPKSDEGAVKQELSKQSSDSPTGETK